MSRTPGGAYQSGSKPVEELKPPPKGPGIGVPIADTVLAKEWRAMADELEKSAQALERHAENLRRRAKVAIEQAELIDGRIAGQESDS